MGGAREGTARGASIAALLLTGCAVGCSLMTSWDGLPLDEEPFPTPDASLDHGAPASDAGAPDRADAPPDDATASDASSDCTIGGYYCGGDKLPGDSSTLYQCTQTGPVPAIVCQHNCARRAGRDDACICVVGSRYCGGDQVLGDSHTLYTCNADYSTTLAQRCPTQCVPRAGQDDTCQ